MYRIVINIVVTALALLLASRIVPGISVASLYSALTAALLLGVLNIFVRPILSILTFPITLLTFGLFSFVINALLFWFAASVIDGFTVVGFVPALLGSLIVAIVSTVMYRILT